MHLLSKPKGGTHALVQALVKLFEDIGGEIRLADPVAEILTEGDRATGIRTEAGWQGQFDTVASNADVVFTYDKLLGNTARGQQAARSMKRRSFSPSIFLIHFGVEGSYPELSHHNILFGPRYKAHLKELYNGPELSEDFSLYLHNPTVTDPDLAPPGCSTYYALAPVPNGRGEWQPVAAALRSAKVLADVFMILGKPFDGIGTAGDGECLPDGHRLWPASGATQQLCQ